MACSKATLGAILAGQPLRCFWSSIRASMEATTGSLSCRTQRHPKRFIWGALRYVGPSKISSRKASSFWSEKAIGTTAELMNGGSQQSQFRSLAVEHLQPMIGANIVAKKQKSVLIWTIRGGLSFRFRTVRRVLVPIWNPSEPKTAALSVLNRNTNITTPYKGNANERPPS